MKNIISLFALMLALSSQLFSTEPIITSTTDDIRAAISTLVSQVDKATVYQSSEKVRICFSVDSAGEVTLYQVFDASPDLKEELILAIHKSQTELSGMNDEILWLSLEVKANP